MGFEALDLTQYDRLGKLVEQVIGVPEVDSFVDAVGFAARGPSGTEQPAVILNQAVQITRAAGAIGISGLYVTEDPRGVDEASRTGNLSLRFGQRAKSQSFHMGQTPTLRYNRQLMQAILPGRLPIAEIVNATVIPPEQAAEGDKAFDSGVAKRFVLDPHGMPGAQAAYND